MGHEDIRQGIHAGAVGLQIDSVRVHRISGQRHASDSSRTSLCYDDEEKDRVRYLGACSAGGGNIPPCDGAGKPERKNSRRVDRKRQ